MTNYSEKLLLSLVEPDDLDTLDSDTVFILALQYIKTRDYFVKAESGVEVFW